MGSPILALGESPRCLVTARVHTGPVIMLTHEMITTAFGKIRRSGFHHFLTSVFSVKRTTEAERDAVGGLMVVIVSAVVVLFMRLILAN